MADQSKNKLKQQNARQAAGRNMQNSKRAVANRPVGGNFGNPNIIWPGKKDGFIDDKTNTKLSTATPNKSALMGDELLKSIEDKKKQQKAQEISIDKMIVDFENSFGGENFKLPDVVRFALLSYIEKDKSTNVKIVQKVFDEIIYTANFYKKNDNIDMEELHAEHLAPALKKLSSSLLASFSQSTNMGQKFDTLMNVTDILTSMVFPSKMKNFTNILPVLAIPQTIDILMGKNIEIPADIRAKHQFDFKIFDNILFFKKQLQEQGSDNFIKQEIAKVGKIAAKLGFIANMLCWSETIYPGQLIAFGYLPSSNELVVGRVFPSQQTRIERVKLPFSNEISVQEKIKIFDFINSEKTVEQFQTTKESNASKIQSVSQLQKSSLAVEEKTTQDQSDWEKLIQNKDFLLKLQKCKSDLKNAVFRLWSKAYQPM